MTPALRALVLLACLPGAALQADLIGHWTFDEASLAETSGFRAAGTHDGVAEGLVRFSDDTPPGRSGMSLELTPGKAPFGVTIRNTSTNEAGYQDTFDEFLKKSGQGTLAFWIKGREDNNRPASPDAQWVALLTKTGALPGAKPEGFGLRFNAVRRHVAFEALAHPAPPFRLATGPVVLDGQWHHVAVVLDGQTAIYYLDGVRQGSLPMEISRWCPAPHEPLRFGAETTKAPFRGKLDDIRLYNESLDATAIQRLKDGTP